MCIRDRVKGVKAGLCTYVGQAVTARAHNNCNILVLSADFTDLEKNWQIVKIFLESKFTGEKRNKRRLKKISDYEEKNK